MNTTVKAATPAAFRRLIALTLGFCERSLIGPHWGEQQAFRAAFALERAIVGG